MSNGGPVFDSGAAPDWDRATVARQCGADGRYDKTAVHNLQAQERNPLSQILKRQLAWIYACAGRYDEAIAQLEESRAHMGDSPDWLRAAFGQEFIAKSMYPDAIGALESAVRRARALRGSCGEGDEGGLGEDRSRGTPSW